MPRKNTKHCVCGVVLLIDSKNGAFQILDRKWCSISEQKTVFGQQRDALPGKFGEQKEMKNRDEFRSHVESLEMK